MAQTALVVAGLAALASLITALLTLWSWWQDNRGLHINLRADPWGEFEDLRHEAGFVLEVSNRARTPNWVQPLTCYVDSKPLTVVLAPQDFITREIKPVSFSRAAVQVVKRDLPETFTRLEFVVIPVRGRPRTFRFDKGDLLPEF